jgi:pilus assembly protein Flp/PilA
MVCVDGQKTMSATLVEREVNGMLFLPREKGQGLVEYALILVLVAIVVIAILLLLGPIIGNIFSNIINAI